MDINSTYFHMLNGEDWVRELDVRQINDLWWDSDRASLSLLPQILKFSRNNDSLNNNKLQDSKSVTKLSDRRGAARDRYNNSYWISEDKRSIYIMPASGEEPAIYWYLDKLTDTEINKKDPANDFHPLITFPDVSEVRLSGLTVSTHHYLVVGTLRPGGLLIFDLHGGGMPGWLQWPEECQFSPFDMAADVQGGITVLDSNLQTDIARYWQLDRYFRVLHPVAENVGIHV
ncbi:MAG TPA: hypothetical protein ENJ08_15095, partial [Gammaproteobacteria bacterium]|nr:hypothetical protein [Gammaproteobacteria bacterium]